MAELNTQPQHSRVPDENTPNYLIRPVDLPTFQKDRCFAVEELGVGRNRVLPSPPTQSQRAVMTKPIDVTEQCCTVHTPPTVTKDALNVDDDVA